MVAFTNEQIDLHATSTWRFPKGIRDVQICHYSRVIAHRPNGRPVSPIIFDEIMRMDM